MRTLLLFDGLGSTNEELLPELRALRASPENATYFQVVSDTLDEIAAYLGPPTLKSLFPDGFDLRGLLKTTSEPSGSQPSNSLAAGLHVFTYQACHLQPTRRHEDGAVASLGHSIGLPAAIIASMQLRRMDEFIETVASFLRLVAISLARGHQLAGMTALEGGMVDRYRAKIRRGSNPGPMASVTGMSRDELSDLIAESTRNGKSLSVGLANSPSSHVLSGPAKDLLEFYFSYAERFEHAGASWSFLSNTIPFHSQHLGPTAARVDEDRHFIGRLPGGDELRLPVYATDTPRNLQGSTDLVAEFLQQVLVRPIEWELVTRHAMTASAVERVVDYGPGAAARRFTRECLGDAARGVRFAAVRPSVASGASGGQRAMSTLSRPGRTAQRNGSRPVPPLSGPYGDGR